MKGQGKEQVFLIIRIIGLTVLIAWLFYDSFVGLFSGVFTIPFLLWEYRDQVKQKRQYEMESQFSAGLAFAAAGLEAGLSVERAWCYMQQEIQKLYGADAPFVVCVNEMNQGVQMNQPLEKMIYAFAQQTESENVKGFADVFCFAKRSGGNMTAIMRRTADQIKQNYQIQEEIQLVLASRNLELQVMNILPFFILAYLRCGSAEYVTPLYHCPLGIFVMSSCLGIYFLAYGLAKRLIRIGV